MEDESADLQVFDTSAMKKKKKPKKPFDLEAVLQNDSADTKASESADVESQAQQLADDIDDLDLESFGTKKKKKKKDAVILDEAGEENEESEMGFGEKKKKKKTKKALEDLVGDSPDKENEEEATIEAEETGVSTWGGSDRDYTYDELLLRVFDIMRQKNPDMAAGTKQKFVMRPPQVVRIGTKKSSFVNFMEICKMLHRPQKHLLDFLLSELGTSGSIDGNNQLIIKGRFQQKQIENVLRRYIKEYVTCHTCRSPNTLLQKDSRIFFLQCEACGSRCSVASIKHGFQAVTGKRAAIRAKAT